MLFQVRECIIFKKRIEYCRIDRNVLKSIVIAWSDSKFELSDGRIIEREIIYLDNWEIGIESRLMNIDAREKSREVRPDIRDISAR